MKVHWIKYFRLKRHRAGELIFPGIGSLNFAREKLPEKKLLHVVEHHSEILELTEEGIEKYYGKTSEPLSDSLSVSEVVSNIKEAISAEEVEYYMSMKPRSKQVKREGNKRLAEFK